MNNKPRALLMLLIPLLVLLAGPASERANAETNPFIARRLWRGFGGQQGGFFGESVDTAGDVNGDGFNDIIVGAMRYDGQHKNMGRAFVFYGAHPKPSHEPDWTAIGEVAGDEFGRDVASAGDVNGDGFDDVLVGAVFASNPEHHEGRVYLYYGSPDGLDTAPGWTAEGNQGGALFGSSLASAGDVNGDGYDDIIVGAYCCGPGRAYVYHGSAQGPAAAPNWTGQIDQSREFGGAVASAGDVNGDGYDDVIVGDRSYSEGAEAGGGAFLFYGSAAGLATTPGWQVVSDHPWARYGQSVASAGDVNGDGYDDVIVGAHEYDGRYENEGAALLYLGAPGGLSLTPDWVTVGDQKYAQYGVSVASAGDMNRDGFADVIVGTFNFSHDHRFEGRASIFYGSAEGLELTARKSFEGQQAGASFGYAVSSAGDVNGDGFDEVIIGAYRYDKHEEDEGMATVISLRH